MRHLHHIDSPVPVPSDIAHTPLGVSGWFVDREGRGAALVRVSLGPIQAECAPETRADVEAHCGLDPAKAGMTGFRAVLTCPAGPHRLLIEAVTRSGEIVTLENRILNMRIWDGHPLRLADRLRAEARALWNRHRKPDARDTVLVLIPAKPGSPAASVSRARELAARALRELPAAGRVVIDERGPAAAPRVEHPWRVAALASIRQAMIDQHLGDERWIFWVDLDMADYPANLIASLVSRAGGGIAAPMIFMADATAPQGGLRFYDLAGFVEEGRWADASPPYFRQPGPVYDLQSVGSCYLVPSGIYRRGARHEQDIGSHKWIASHGGSAADTPRRDWHHQAYTEHHSVCAFARREGLPVRAFADLVAFHEYVS